MLLAGDQQFPFIRDAPPSKFRQTPAGIFWDGQGVNGEAKFGLGGPFVDILAARPAALDKREPQHALGDGHPRCDLYAAGILGLSVCLRDHGEIVGALPTLFDSPSLPPPIMRIALHPGIAKSTGLTALLVVCVLPVHGAGWSAQPQPSRAEIRRDIADVAQPWDVQFEPTTWFVAPGGRVRMPGAPVGVRDLRLEQVNLDNPRFSPYGELHVRSGEWRFSLSSFATSQSDRGVVYARPDWIGPHFVTAGETVTSSFDFASVELNVGYRIPIPDTLVGRGGRDFRGSLEAIGGLRLYRLGFEFDTPHGVVSHDDTLLEPLIGLRYTMEIREQFNIDVQVSLAGFDDGAHRSSVSYDIISGFSYRPVENVGINIGYRQLAYDLRTGREIDQFQYSGALAGLFAGVVIRF